MVKQHVHEAELEPVADICGSSIDLINPQNAGSERLSLATVFVEPGKGSKPHYHKITEEIYYFVEGYGRVFIDGKAIEVSPGSSVYIPRLSVHSLINDSKVRMKLISSDAPPFDLKDIFYPEA